MYERENVPESNLVGGRPLQKFEMKELMLKGWTYILTLFMKIYI